MCCISLILRQADWKLILKFLKDFVKQITSCLEHFNYEIILKMSEVKMTLSYQIFKFNLFASLSATTFKIVPVLLLFQCSSCKCLFRFITFSDRSVFAFYSILSNFYLLLQLFIFFLKYLQFISS